MAEQESMRVRYMRESSGLTHRVLYRGDGVRFDDLRCRLDDVEGSLRHIPDEQEALSGQLCPYCFEAKT